MLKTLIIIGFGGFFGSISRYVLSQFIDKNLTSFYPYGTFLVNFIGCVLLGFIYAMGEKEQILSSDMRFFLATGFCGSFTTFSTFSYENQELLNQGQWGIALTYIILSIIIGISATFGGVFLGRTI